MILCNPNGTCRTGLFTDTATDTAYFTLFLCRCSFALIGAFYNNIVCTFMNVNNLLRTDLCSFRKIAPNLHSCMQAPQPIQPSAHPCPSFAVRHPPLHATRAARYGNLFFTAISPLPFVWCICKRQTVSPYSVIAEICVCNRRCCRNRRDFSDTDCTARYI